MLQVLLLAGLLGQLNGETSRVTAEIGTLNIRRGPSLLSGDVGSNVIPGDRLETSDSGGAIWYYRQAVVTYLGSRCETITALEEGNLSLTVLRGELRVVANGNVPVQLGWNPNSASAERGIIVASAPRSRAEFDRGIVRIRRESGKTHFYCELGQALVTTTEESATLPSGLRPVRFQEQSGPVVLTAGNQLTLIDTGEVQGPMPVNAQQWTIDPLEFRLAQTLALRNQKRQGQDDDEEEEEEQPPQEPDADQPDSDILGGQIAATAGISLALGATSSSTSFGSSGSLFSDAQQESVNLGFPGSIHLVTAQNSYTLSDVQLTSADNFPTSRQFWSIGTGDAPTSQVKTDFITGTGLTPRTVQIPGFDAYIVQLDQYGVPDPVSNTANSGQLGIAGLVGATPQSPSILGATPLLDERSDINDRATFALGELAVDLSGNNPTFDIRRSDQDRRIVKDPGGDDDKDVVTPNKDATFTDQPDYQFFPQVPLPGVKVPTALNGAPSYSGLTGSRANFLRKAAFTTLIADQLHDHARRTGQTRFVVDGKIVDITGYRR